MKDLKIKIIQYINEYYAPGSQPDPRTIVARIKRGEIVGTKEGRNWYVYPNRTPNPELAMQQIFKSFDNELNNYASTSKSW